MRRLISYAFFPRLPPLGHRFKSHRGHSMDRIFSPSLGFPPHLKLNCFSESPWLQTRINKLTFFHRARKSSEFTVLTHIGVFGGRKKVVFIDRCKFLSLKWNVLYIVFAFLGTLCRAQVTCYECREETNARASDCWVNPDGVTGGNTVTGCATQCYVSINFTSLL